MKKPFLSTIFLIWFIQVQAQWFNLNSPTTDYLYSTYYVNYDTGYAVGGDINSSVFLKTVNGGIDWNILTNTQTKWLYDLVFLNDTIGLACGYDGAMYKTTDAGESWNAKPSETTAWLYAIAKKPDGTIYATGTDGALIRSTNMGDNWDPAVSSTVQTMLDIQFLDNNYGVAVGYAGEMIYTTDGGTNWAVKLMGTTASITGVWMQSADTMWTCGFQGKIYKTTNAGQNFTLITPVTNDLNAIFFSDDVNGYAVGAQIILQTTDGGANWTPMSYPSSNGLKDIHVSPDNRVMYAVGDNGAMIKNINSIGIENMIDEMVLLYPNPSDGLLSVPLTGNFEINIFNLTGKLVRTEKFVDANDAKLDIRDLPNGQYILEVNKQSRIHFVRVIVNR